MFSKTPRAQFGALLLAPRVNFLTLLSFIFAPAKIDMSIVGVQVGHQHLVITNVD
jgi:hypothetical protein